MITNVETARAAVADVAMTAPVHDALIARGLAPGEHTADSGFASGDELVAARRRGIALIGPLVGDNSAQARGGGYTTGAFTGGFSRQQAACPRGIVSRKWAPTRNATASS